MLSPLVKHKVWTEVLDPLRQFCEKEFLGGHMCTSAAVKV